MKNVYEKPEVEVISLEPMDSITANDLETGDGPSSMGGGSIIIPTP